MMLLFACLFGIPLGCVVASRAMAKSRAESRCMCCNKVDCECFGYCRDCGQCALCCRCGAGE